MRLHYALCLCFLLWTSVAGMPHTVRHAAGRHNGPPVSTVHVVATWSAYATHMADHAHAFYRLAGRQGVTAVNYIAVNSGNTDTHRAAIDRAAVKNKVACLVTHTVCSSLQAASLNHACSLNTALQRLLANHTFIAGDVVIFTDSDIIPVDVDAVAMHFDVLGLPQEREGVEYLWPNLLVLRISDRLLHALPDLSFDAMATPVGLGTDSGGMISVFLKNNPWLHVAHFDGGKTHPYTAAATFMDRMKRVRSKYPKCHQSELLSSHAATFMHLGSAGSNWRHCPEALLAQAWNSVFGFVDDLDNCVVESVVYESSAVERWWLEQARLLNVSDMAQDAPKIEAYCGIIADQRNAVLAMVGTGAPHTSADDLDADVFSSFLTTRRCKSGRQHTRSYIEPLFGVLRDPRSFCGHLFGRSNATMLTKPWYRRPFMLSRDSLVLGVSTTAQSRLFVDLGASLFDQGPGGASQQYFYEAYGRAGTLFDRYMAWEAKPIDPEQLLAAVPDDLFASYQYFNTPVSKNTSSPKFPVNVLKSVASTHDFVAFKLDIDLPDIEDVVVAELSKPAHAGLLDEFFWEQHGGSLRDQYERLLRFRQMGVRAHAWP